MSDLPDTARPAIRPAPRRFLIVGLPRSGTTYLMTLLNAHRDILCSGERFNPFAIVGVAEKDFDPAALRDRDAMPLRFMDRFFETAEATGAARVGFKFMLGHNIRVLRALAERPDLALIHVWRENRLAQISSLIKAEETRRWAQSTADDHVARKIAATPQQINQRWHEYVTTEFLFRAWMDRLPNPSIRLEYRTLFQPGFAQQICDFLDLPVDPEMRSPLVKQGANTVLDRFEKPAPILRYFTALGLARWLEPEI